MNLSINIVLSNNIVVRCTVPAIFTPHIRDYILKNFYLERRKMNLSKKICTIVCASFILLLNHAAMNAQTDAKSDTNNISSILNSISYLKNLKISGYVQAQYQHSESVTGFGASPYMPNENINNQFQIRRAILKLDYSTELTQMVIQTDFLPSGVSVKEAYLKVTDPWAKAVSLNVGLFNRPDFEVEYSANQIESLERSNVIRALYPGERDLGAMFTINPNNFFNLQLAGFNNTYQGFSKQLIPNYRYEPFYFMARLTKKISFKPHDTKINFGVNCRIGNAEANTNQVIFSENNNKIIDSTSYIVGDKLSRSWFGAEFQYSSKILGGLKFFAEYLMGNNIYEESAANAATIAPIRLTKFNGYYLMLVKPIASDWEIAGKYDYYNPNSKIEEENINSTKDLAVSTLGYGIHNYSFKNIRISLWYDMNFRQTTDNFSEMPSANLLTLRLQYKF